MSETFQGSQDYVASEELMRAVNIAMVLQKPLLIKGEPGTGKTVLAEAIAKSLGKELIIWNIKSTTKAQDGLYVYDVVQRLYDSQFGGEGVDDIEKYVKLGKLGEAFTADDQVILLIDEIDKADLEFPQRPAVGAGPDGVPHPGDGTHRHRQAPPHRHYHLQRGEGAARRLPAPLRIPLHRVPRPGADGRDRQRALPKIWTSIC